MIEHAALDALVSRKVVENIKEKIDAVNSHVNSHVNFYEWPKLKIG